MQGVKLSVSVPDSTTLVEGKIRHKYGRFRSRMNYFNPVLAMVQIDRHGIYSRYSVKLRQYADFDHSTFY